MASVTLDALWLHDSTDLADHIVLEDVTGIGDTPRRSGEVRTYAGGRQRIITKAAKPRAVAVTAEWVPRADKQWIEDRLGRLLLLRDMRGRKLWGTIFQPQWDEHQVQDVVTLHTAFQLVTHSEAV